MLKSAEWEAIVGRCHSDEEREGVQIILHYIVTILFVTVVRVRLIGNARIYVACAVGSLIVPTPFGLNILWAR